MGEGGWSWPACGCFERCTENCARCRAENHSTHRAPHLPWTLNARPPSGVRAACTVCASPWAPCSLTSTSHTWVGRGARGRGAGCWHAQLGPLAAKRSPAPPTWVLSELARSASAGTVKVLRDAANAKQRASRRDDCRGARGVASAGTRRDRNEGGGQLGTCRQRGRASMQQAVHLAAAVGACGMGREEIGQ